MFNLQSKEAGWYIKIKDDMIKDCNKHEGVIHIYVEKKLISEQCVCEVPINCCSSYYCALHGR
jgi:hypothetical protein